MDQLLVLCYHAVSPSWTAATSVTPENFEYQINHLHDRGWQYATFTQAVLRPPAKRTAVITFDDAYASVKRYAAPLLARIGAPATVFAPTSFVAGRLSWPGIDCWQDGPDADELAAMTWEDLRELSDCGWEIGSHTRTHRLLTELSDEDLEQELRDSRSECARKIGRDCLSIAYPYGNVNARVADATRRAGYSAGAALSRRLERLGPYRHPRIGIYHDDAPRRFRLKTIGAIRELRASRLWPIPADQPDRAPSRSSSR